MAGYSKTRAAIWVGSALILATAQLPKPALGCASVSIVGEDVQVVDESAVIIWDAARHQEHFIRRASFNATSNNFGFMVPTPSVPVLAEADDETFTNLEHLIRPKTISEHRWAGFTLFSLFGPVFAGATEKGVESLSSVQVLPTQHVAGYDAVVLSADDAGALQRWLQSHGYEARPALVAWLTPYVQAHWKITAFKISKDNPRTASTASSAVRMSFTTNRPFFPYREPADQREPGHHASERSLRIFLLSAARMEGALGEAGTPASWPGKVFAANPITNGDRNLLENSLSLSTQWLPKSLWLTTFQDLSSPRPGTDDVYFAPSAQRNPIEPPPLIMTREEKTHIPIEALIPVAGLGIFLWRKSRPGKRTGVLLRRSP